jgi:hypothetical protein
MKGCLTDAKLMNLPLFVWALHNRVSQRIVAQTDDGVEETAPTFSPATLWPSVDECRSCYKAEYVGTTKNVQEFVKELPKNVTGWALLLEPFHLQKVDQFLQTVYGARPPYAGPAPAPAQKKCPVGKYF